MTLSINLPTNNINTITKNHLFNFQTITFFVKLTKIVKFPTLKFKNNIKRIEVVPKKSKVFISSEGHTLKVTLYDLLLTMKKIFNNYLKKYDVQNMAFPYKMNENDLCVYLELV